MPRAPKAPIDPDDAPLRRLGGGRWQTRDERFTVEPQSGTWVIVDAEQTDDFGMALVRGPFASLTAAKDAISTARSSAPAESPLADRIKGRGLAPEATGSVAHSTKSNDATKNPSRKAPRLAAASDGEADDDRSEPRAADPTPRRHGSSTTPNAEKREDTPTGDDTRAGAGAGAGTMPPAKDASERAAPPEPAWIGDLGASQRGRARRLIAALRAKGVADAEGLVRRDLAGGVPSLAALAIADRLDRLGTSVSAAAVADLLADGRDDDLGVRWRLVDGEGRPILLDPSALRRR